MSKKKLDDLGVSAFCESMAMMLQAGIQTDEAIGLLKSGKENGGILEQGLVVMKDCLEKGSGLAASMEESGIFPDYALRMTAMGESSGHLEEVLFRLSAYYADQKSISDKLRSAVSYPAAMLLLILAVLAVMLRLVLPAFTRVYDSLTGSLAASRYRYIYWSYGFCRAALILTALLAIVLFGGLFFWNRGYKQQIEKLLSRNGICRSILESLGMLRFTSALSTFLASGALQDEAVEKSLPMTEYPPVEARIQKCLEHMKEGHSFAQAAYEEELFEPVYGRMLLAGERSGQMEKVLSRLTRLLEEHCKNLVDRLIGILDPLLSGILMLSVGLSLLSIMLPLLGMMESIG